MRNRGFDGFEAHDFRSLSKKTDAVDFGDKGGFEQEEAEVPEFVKTVGILMSVVPNTYDSFR